MVCIYCSNDTGVYNSRAKARTPSVWRRRRCLACVAQFTTLELPDYDSALMVEGLRGKLYPFRRDKLFLSLHRALGHRKDAIVSASELASTVLGRLLMGKKAPDGVLQIELVAKTSYAVLKRYDPLAAHSYKAYHQSAIK
ncbi:MAG: hypothetical protein WAQ57_00140 [Candidatus Saccharimonadales bacterium]